MEKKYLLALSESGTQIVRDSEKAGFHSSALTADKNPISVSIILESEREVLKMKISKYCPNIYKLCVDRGREEYEFQEQKPKLY